MQKNNIFRIISAMSSDKRYSLRQTLGELGGTTVTVGHCWQSRLQLARCRSRFAFWHSYLNHGALELEIPELLADRLPWKKGKVRKIRAPIKIKSALSPPPQKPPPKKGNFTDMVFPAERTHFFRVFHKIGAPISGPRIADTNFTDTRIFMKKDPPPPRRESASGLLLRTPGRFTTRPLPVYFTTKMSVVRPFSVLSKDELALSKTGRFLSKAEILGVGVSYPLSIATSQKSCSRGPCFGSGPGKPNQRKVSS